jgi:hypothetical protein
MKVFLHWQLDFIKLRLLRLFLNCSLFYSSILSVHLVLIENTALKPVYHTRIGSIYAPTTRPWVSLRCCRGDVYGGASGDRSTAPMECYDAGADDTHAAGLVCFDDVAGRAPARTPGDGTISHRQTLSACSTSANKSSVSSMPAA